MHALEPVPSTAQSMHTLQQKPFHLFPAKRTVCIVSNSDDLSVPDTTYCMHTLEPVPYSAYSKYTLQQSDILFVPSKNTVCIV